MFTSKARLLISVCGPLFLSLAGSSDVPKFLNKNRGKKKNFPKIRCFLGGVGYLEWPATSILNQRQTAGILNEREREREREREILSRCRTVGRFYDLRVNLYNSSRTEERSHGAGRPSGTAKDDGAQGRRPCVARSRTLSGSQDRRASSIEQRD